MIDIRKDICEDRRGDKRAEILHRDLSKERKRAEM